MTTLKNKKELISWAFYDWASSAFPTVIITFIYAPFYTTQVAKNDIQGTYEWAFANAVAALLVALLSPLFGAIADYKGFHKRWLIVCTYSCIFFTALLWFSYPHSLTMRFVLIFYVLALFFLEVGVVFYNSYLNFLVPEQFIGRASGWAWGLGYIGGIVALSICLFVFIKHPPYWLNTESFQQVRISGPFVAVWFAIFSLPLFLYVREIKITSISTKESIYKGMTSLITTLKTLPKEKNIMLFLIAHLFYIDGLNTLFAFGGIYAAGTFGMSLENVILFGIFLNLAAGLGAILLAWMDDFVGSKPTIMLSLIGLLLFGIPIVLLHNVVLFWIFSGIICLFVGSVQAASRSLMARLAPAERSTELFGLYSFSGKITSFFGPWLLGLATYYFHSQRAGMSTILIFFVIGFILMIRVQNRYAPS